MGEPSRLDAVLFTCTMNVVRSPMAAALLRHTHGARLFVDSCGLKQATAPLDAFAAAAMDEIGLSLSDHAPKTFDMLEDGSFDLVISLTPEAQHGAVELARGRSVELEYWPTPDPTLQGGSRQQRLDAYRAVRDGLRRRIVERFGRPSTFGG